MVEAANSTAEVVAMTLLRWCSVRAFMDAQERRRDEVLELVRKNLTKIRDVESKGVLQDFVVGDYVHVARVRQPGITPKLMNTWTGPWRVVSKT